MVAPRRPGGSWSRLTASSEGPSRSPPGPPPCARFVGRARMGDAVADAQLAALRAAGAVANAGAPWRTMAGNGGGACEHAARRRHPNLVAEPISPAPTRCGGPGRDLRHRPRNEFGPRSRRWGRRRVSGDTGSAEPWGRQSSPRGWRSRPTVGSADPMRCLAHPLGGSTDPMAPATP